MVLVKSNRDRNAPSKHGFTSSTPTGQLHTTSVLYGKTGAQKSSTVFLYWPQPIYTINFDTGRDIPAFERAKNTCSICKVYVDDHDESGSDGNAPAHDFTPIEIYRSPLSSSVDFDKLGKEPAKKEGERQLNEFWRDYTHALDKCAAAAAKTGKAGTICIDTFGELKPRICAAITGSSEIPFKMYKAQGRLNQTCRDIVARAKHARVNLVIVARESEIYRTDKVSGVEKGTGKYKPKIPPALLEAVDFAAYIDVSVETVRNRDTKQRETLVTPSITMYKCGGNTSELFATYTPDDWGKHGPFAWITWNQFLNTRIKDWK